MNISRIETEKVAKPAYGTHRVLRAVIQKEGHFASGKTAEQAWAETTRIFKEGGYPRPLNEHPSDLFVKAWNEFEKMAKSADEAPVYLWDPPYIKDFS